jgi:hypothetical protein
MTVRNPVGMVWLGFLLAAAGCGGAAWAGDGCVDFKWDVAHERAVFARAAVATSAGIEPAAAPALSLDRLYRMRLVANAKVAYPVPPGKAPAGDGFAGLATLTVPSDGSYRIALDAPVWIDVAVDGALVGAADFQGQRDCSAPHKIVEFQLKAKRRYILQLSGATTDAVSLSVTAAPARLK